MDKLKASPEGRVVNLSSMAHRNGKIHFEDLQLKKGYGPRIAYD
jgi:hypothetical protein